MPRPNIPDSYIGKLSDLSTLKDQHVKLKQQAGSAQQQSADNKHKDTHTDTHTCIHAFICRLQHHTGHL